VRRDPNKCVKCGKCVEVCDAGRGLAILGFTSRGFEASVGPVLDQPLVETACEACGDCVAVCPVGALTEIVPLGKPGPYDTEPVASTCAGCSLGCDVGVHAIANSITRVTPRDDGWNGVHMCRKGRFEWIDANADGVAVDRAAAVTELAAKLAGGQIVLGADCTNEEGVLAQVVAAKLGGKAAWLAPDPAAVAAQQATLAAASGTVTVEDLAAAPAAVAWGADLGTDFPVAGVGLRRAILRGGEVKYVDCTDHRAGSDRELAAEDHEAILEMLGKEGAVLVAGPAAGDLSELVRRTGCKVLALRQGPNAAGLTALELDAVDASALRNGTPTLLLGDAPAGMARPGAFFAAQSVARAAKLDADLVLPRTHYLDDAGTVVATDGRVCTLRPARRRPANWELLRELAQELGVEVDVEALLEEARALQV
jgi:NADH dehydrogenase/NADH:ubiquinone oxidoreductase subunit G